MAKAKKIKIRKDGEFIPPDGGWGWMIIFAAGFSNLSALPLLQQFGLLFRDKFARLGISSSETTTIINMNSALTSCVGLANGPVFKTFSYRQVSLTGAIVVFTALMATTFSNNFITYLISFSILYGAGYGISSSANALALNTYWKKRRRLATSLSWTTTGMGPMLWPHIITALFAVFGETGTILIISGISLHAIACALLLQPVEWHCKTPDEIKADEEKLLKEDLNNKKNVPDKTHQESGYFSQVSKLRNLSAFSSQYLYNEDDAINTGYEITDPGIPMMIRANDGYFSSSRQSRSRISSREGSNKNSRLNSKKPSMTNLLENRSRKSSTLYLNESKKNSSANLGALAQERDTYKPKRKTSITLGTQIPESEIEDCPTLKAPQDLKAEEKEAVENIDPEKAKFIADRAEKHLATSKSIKSFRMDGQYGEKYSKDNHSNSSYKNQEDSEEKKYLKDNHSNQSYRTKHRRIDGQYGEKYSKDNHSNTSYKNQEDNEERKYLKDNHSNQSYRNKHRRMDGQYGEKYSKDNHSNTSFKNQEDNEERKYLKDNHSNQSYRTKHRRKSNNFNYESEVLKQASLKLEEYLKENEVKSHADKIKLLINGPSDDEEDDDESKDKKLQEEEEEEEKLTFCQKVAIFFDLDLLKDFTFINLMLGITLANFNELNFSILTPFILGDYGMTKSEVAFFMSLLAGVDLCVRFCIPIVAGKIGWDNNSFFLFGVMTMAMGRVVLSIWQSYRVALIVAVMIGFGKGLRTVFMALVIPTHVPLHKLPGASGIQLLTAGIVYLILGPFVGWIKDNAPPAVTLHCLNIFTWLTAISWGLEKYFRSRKKTSTDTEIEKA